MFTYFTNSQYGTDRVEIKGSAVSQILLNSADWKFEGYFEIDEIVSLVGDTLPINVNQGNQVYDIIGTTDKAVKVKSGSLLFFVPKKCLFMNGKININYFHNKARLEKEEWAYRAKGLN